MKHLRNLLRFGRAIDDQKNPSTLWLHGEVIDLYSNRLRFRFHETLFLPTTFFAMLVYGLSTGAFPDQAREFAVYEAYLNKTEITTVSDNRALNLVQ